MLYTVITMYSYLTQYGNIEFKIIPCLSGYRQ